MALFDFIKGKRSLISVGVLNGREDRHSHILYGVDDGISRLEDSLAVLSFEESLGTTDVWCTPHIMEDTPNQTEALRQRFTELQNAYDGKIALHLAAEYMLDNLFDERLSSGDILVMGDDEILVETSTWNPPPELYDRFREIQKSGLHPVFAHPERYRYLTEPAYERLNRMGVRFQMNIGSLAGFYGQTAQRKAINLLDNGRYTYLGSDCHRLKAFQDQVSRESVPKGIINKLSF